MNTNEWTDAHRTSAFIVRLGLQITTEITTACGRKPNHDITTTWGNRPNHDSYTYIMVNKDYYQIKSLRVIQSQTAI